MSAMTAHEKLDQKVKDFWGDIIFNSDGSLNVEQVYRELADYQDFMHEVSLAYCDITDSKISKPNTWHKYVIEAVDERIDQARKEAVIEELESIPVVASFDRVYMHILGRLEALKEGK